MKTVRCALCGETTAKREGHEVSLEAWDAASMQIRAAYLQNGDYLSSSDAEKLSARIARDMATYKAMSPDRRALKREIVLQTIQMCWDDRTKGATWGEFKRNLADQLILW